ncbi:alpha/beta hydrolase [Flavobacteriaceae bacterium]|jgi:pimeloyl-ACP methyl ester carboxylesterase|nr:alpha/beta hydrolase [Flavobacteriaceae bacterium]MBT4314427.1 alpha/beta hydrolase [Flavobacteriaceae bacterium]MBT5092203.1 alpha/beta hydrolase [Flavobacteriaceae bacterium]MBT5283408.1 alpha/beta hydrolase [Flavobacteriaceae bacterium]MBT5446794.1 alpha/beta hydrolase [Flavobacteriaceae bacterium]|tara:strand:+ start:14841 stop:15497 length:657 start_codon:yes stop_codon:yes gene_type:complete
MDEIDVYCMPGMAASPKIFEFISLPKPFRIHLLSWIPPDKEESLSSYAKRMCERITSENPILLGVSFGGVLVQEIAKHIPVQKVIIVSSIKTNEELPLPMKMARTTNAHKLLPTQWINNLDALALFAFGKGIKKRLELYQKYLSERNPDYLNWSINALVNWDQVEVPTSVVHIHGEKDTVFPIKYLSNPYIRIKGGHAAIMTQAQWFNSELPDIILKK